MSYLVSTMQVERGHKRSSLISQDLSKKYTEVIFLAILRKFALNECNLEKRTILYAPLIILRAIFFQSRFSLVYRQ
jgi:hypothetical protein